MSKQDEKIVGRRNSLKLAAAVSALGVGLGATFSSKDAQAGAVGTIHGFKLEASKFDKIVLTVHKGDSSTAPLDAAKPGSMSTPGTYVLKLTAFKASTVVSWFEDSFFVT